MFNVLETVSDSIIRIDVVNDMIMALYPQIALSTWHPCVKAHQQGNHGPSQADIDYVVTGCLTLPMFPLLVRCLTRPPGSVSYPWV